MVHCSIKKEIYETILKCLGIISNNTLLCILYSVLFKNFFHYTFLPDIQYSSMCYMVNPCYFRLLNFSWYFMPLNLGIKQSFILLHLISPFSLYPVTTPRTKYNYLLSLFPVTCPRPRYSHHTRSGLFPSVKLLFPQGSDIWEPVPLSLKEYIAVYSLKNSFTYITKLIFSPNC